MIEKYQYIDIHGHVNFAAYDSDREAVIERAERSNVAMITVGTQLDTSRKAVELARVHPGMYAAIGLHPIHTTASHHDAQELGEDAKAFTSRGEQIDIEAYRQLANDPKTVAIGESGLDYYHLDEQSLSKQQSAFSAMIGLAEEVDKPLMLHIRNGDGSYSGKSAYKDAFDMLKDHHKIRGNLHFFAGNIEEAKMFLDLGYTFSFTGVVTFAKNYVEIVKYLPLDRIMSETDCPYVAPSPHRGQRNEPVYVVEVVKALAHIREQSEEVVAAQIMKNARELFSLDD